MNLNLMRPKKEKECFLLTIPRNCETVVKQTHKKAEETLEFKIAQPRGKFHFNPPISMEGSWVTGITKFEAYISLFNITEENKEIELYTQSSDDEFSFVEWKDRVAELLGLSDVSFLILQHEIHGTNIFKTYRKHYQ